jgi:hypothetical protein
MFRKREEVKQPIIFRLLFIKYQRSGFPYWTKKAKFNGIDI